MSNLSDSIKLHERAIELLEAKTRALYWAEEKQDIIRQWPHLPYDHKHKLMQTFDGLAHKAAVIDRYLRIIDGAYARIAGQLCQENKPKVYQPWQDTSVPGWPFLANHYEGYKGDQGRGLVEPADVSD